GGRTVAAVRRGTAWRAGAAVRPLAEQVEPPWGGPRSQEEVRAGPAAWAKRAPAHPRKEDESPRSAEFVAAVFAGAGGAQRRRAGCFPDSQKARGCWRPVRRLRHRRRRLALFAQ